MFKPTMKSVALILGFICMALAEQSSPVFMWNINSPVKPALGLVSQNEFADIVRPLLAENTLVVFMEKNLTFEDFSCTNGAASCYAHLQLTSEKNFYTAVEESVKTLRSLDSNAEISSVNTLGKVSPPLKLEKGKIIFVKFEDSAATDRNDILEKHDFIMESITSAYKNENVFFVYTSETPTVKRVRRQTAASTNGFVFRHDDKFLIYYSSIHHVDDKGKATDLSFTALDVKETNKTALSVTLTGSGSPLKFDVTLAGGYFFMTNVQVDNLVFRSKDVYSLTDFSYFCGNLTLYGSDAKSNGHTLKLNSLQFQAPFGSTTNKNFPFGDPWHCVGFFSGGILSGLLIVALLLSISFVGVCWMMDINTMDRFDDPKGPTITINAAE